MMICRTYRIFYWVKCKRYILLQVTAVLDNHEAVTGTRQGELTIWSMRTGKPLRQLMAPPIGAGMHSLSRKGVTSTTAHQREVKALDVSRDGVFLTSASADTTVKMWHLETEKLLHTFKGHKDEVEYNLQAAMQRQTSVTALCLCKAANFVAVFYGQIIVSALIMAYFSGPSIQITLQIKP